MFEEFLHMMRPLGDTSHVRERLFLHFLFAMMRSKVVENEIYLSFSIPDEPSHEFYKQLCSHAFLIQHKAHLPFIIDRRNHADTVFPGAYSQNRLLALGSKSTSLMGSRLQPCLIT